MNDFTLYPFTLEEIKKWDNKKGIYLLVHDNYPLYVGQSINLGSRLKEHRREGALDKVIKQVIQEGGKCNRCKAIAMYGFINEHREEMEFTILEETKELNEREEFYINLFRPRFNYKGIDVPY